ncbi:MAG: hypothetical protein HN431_01605 [Bacteroidetes bacterium]|nr:hypothetical protein [Bacteroidota bacterium]
MLIVFELLAYDAFPYDRIKHHGKFDPEAPIILFEIVLFELPDEEAVFKKEITAFEEGVN